MTNLSMKALAGLLLVLPVLASGQPAVEAQLFARFQPVVVKLIVTGLDPQQQPSTRIGTGFLIHPRGYLVTARHVVGTPEEWFEVPSTGALVRKIEVVRMGSDGVPLQENLYPRIERYSADADLVIVKVLGDRWKYIEGMPSDQLQNGDAIVAVAWGEDVIPEARSGSIVLAEDPSNEYLIKMSIDLEESDSGSPVFGSDGRLLGVTTRGRVDARKDVYAEPPHRVRDLMDGLPQVAPVAGVKVIFTSTQETLRREGRIEIRQIGTNLTVGFMRPISLQPGKYPIVCWIGDTQVDSNTIEVVAGRGDQEFEVNPDAELAGVVVDGAGRNVADARVWAGNKRVRTGADGRFLLSGVPLQSEYEYELIPPGGNTSTRGSIDNRNWLPSINVTLRVE